MKYIIIFSNVILIINLLIFGASSSFAQEAIKIEPLSIFKSIESEDPLRFYHGGDAGIPAGDLNGDGKTEFLIQNEYYPDFSTPELGDVIDNTLVFNLGENGEITHFIVVNGWIYNPAGDLTNDGRFELVLVTDESLQIHSFEEGAYENGSEATQIFETDISMLMNQFVPGHDFDGDGNQDLLIGSFDYSSDSECHILFGADIPAEFELVSCNGGEEIGDLEIIVNAGDVSGEHRPDIIALSTTQWPHQLSACSFEVDMERNISFDRCSDLGSINVPATNLRFYVSDMDGEAKEDLVFSENRHSSGKGFTQFFFNTPTIKIALSNDYGIQPTIGPIFSAPKVIKEDATVESVNPNSLGLGIGIYNTYKLAYWQRGSLSIIFGIDFIPEVPLITDEAPAETAEGNQFFASKYSPNGNNADVNGDDILDLVFGTGNPEKWEAGRSILKIDEGEIKSETNSSKSFRTFHSEIRETKAIPPNQTNDLIGLGLFGEWFPTQYLSLYAQTSLRLDFLRADETSSPTDNEPNGSFEANGLLGVNVNSGADLFGGTGFTVWFNKVANSDTSTLIHSFRVHDFQDFDEDDNVSVKMNNIGDINNDGYDDLLMSSGYSYSNSFPVNKAWLFYGGESYNSIPDYTFDFSQDSATANKFGTFITHKMEPLGDFNGDEIDDFAVQARGYGTQGAVYVYFGDEEFFSTEVEQTEFKYPDLILTPEIIPEQTISGFGKDIASGDFDGNGDLELAITLESGYGNPTPATIYMFKNDGDQIPDMLLTGTKSSLGKEGDEIVSSTFSSSIIFLPKENGENHQDLLFTPGGFSGYPDAIIFEGGVEADSLPDIILSNPNRVSGFGSIDGSKPGVADLNNDGFYDILMLSQADYEDGFISSRVYSFSPNSNIIIDSNEPDENPFGYRLSQNYPNPFNPNTYIEFKLPRSLLVSLKVYDLLGREVAIIVNSEIFSSGSQTVNFDASNLASGMYIYRLEAGSFIQTRKMLLIK
ncbi:MAG: T9SS type A sorting domain-containing protein [Balneolaceae bacterium]